ncbi:MAG: hypothetical protein IJ540_03260 [Prevotella sp.]|nr:hypothetical protein [Prevotella sp.]
MQNTTSEYQAKMLGLVTLFNSSPDEAATNIKRYVNDLDELIVWDNTPLDKNLKADILASLHDVSNRIIWKGDGKNHFIAPAINFAWHYAQEHGYQLLLLMDQDSSWEDFQLFRQQVNECYRENCNRVFCPFISGNDTFEIVQDIQAKRIFINSGTVVPINILNNIGGADEAFELDALDHDLAIRIQKAGYDIVCLTKHILHHQVGHMQRMGSFHIFTHNYNAQRTYSITKSHILKFRKHWNWLSSDEIRETIKIHYIRKFVTIILAEPQKFMRMKMFFKGIYDGVTYHFPTKESCTF